MSLTDDARAAWTAAQEAEASAEQSERNAVAVVVKARLAEVLAGADGKPRALTGARVVDHTSMENGSVSVVVLFDGLHFGIRRTEADAPWLVGLVEKDDGYVLTGDVTSLADLGRLLGEG